MEGSSRRLKFYSRDAAPYCNAVLINLLMKNPYIVSLDAEASKTSRLLWKSLDCGESHRPSISSLKYCHIQPGHLLIWTASQEDLVCCLLATEDVAEVYALISP